MHKGKQCFFLFRTSLTHVHFWSGGMQSECTVPLQVSSEPCRSRTKKSKAVWIPGSAWQLLKEMLEYMQHRQQMSLKSWRRLATIRDVWVDVLRTANASEVLVPADNDQRRRSTRCTENSKWVCSPDSGWQQSEETPKWMHQEQQMV